MNDNDEKTTKREKDPDDKNFQYVVNRQKISFSDIPLEALFNPTIDKVKQYEKK